MQSKIRNRVIIILIVTIAGFAVVFNDEEAHRAFGGVTRELLGDRLAPLTRERFAHISSSRPVSRTGARPLFTASTAA